jgi:hypothetical protein
MTRIVDAEAEKLQSFIIQEYSGPIVGNTYYRLDYLIKRKVPRPELGTNGICTPQAITPYLTQCRTLVEKELAKRASRFSSLQWMWYLRRLPRSIFEGSISTTWAYDFVLAHIIAYAGAHTPRRPNIVQKNIAFNVKSSIARFLLQYASEVKFLSQIHVMLRFAGKGASFKFGEAGLPEYSITPELEAAIHLYDVRNSNTGLSFGRMGTNIVAESKAGNSDDPLVVYAVAKPDWAPTLMGEPTEDNTVEVLVNYRPTLENFEGLAALAQDSRFGSEYVDGSVGILLLLLYLAFPLVVTMNRLGRTHPFVSLARYGYMVLPTSMFIEVVDSLLGDYVPKVIDIMGDISLPSSANGLIESLELFDSRFWPAKFGQVHHQYHEILYLDLWGASIRLSQILEFPKGTGEISHARGEHFEKVVQKEIDASSWCPPKDLHSMRRRTLRYSSRAIGDLDAVGHRAGKLLIASCKSYVYSGQYDIGDYKSVRNLSSTLEQDVADLKAFVAFLTSHPKGDNYDFSEYHDILALICTPQVIFVPIGTATETIDTKLYIASSFPEFRKWLSGFSDS